MNAIVRIPAAPAISIFRFDNHDIRVVEIDGLPWFVGADVCKAAASRTRPSRSRRSTRTRGLRSS